MPLAENIDIVPHPRGTVAMEQASREPTFDQRGIGVITKFDSKPGAAILAGADRDDGIRYQRFWTERFSETFVQGNIIVNPDDSALRCLRF